MFTGTTTSTLTNGYFYKCVSDGESTPTYTWEQVNVQDSVSVDGTTIVKDASTDEISAVTATNSTKGIVQHGDGTEIGSNGEINVVDRLEKKSTLPTASATELGNQYLYIGASTSSLNKGGIYECQEVTGTDPTEYEWVLISTSPLTFNEDDFDVDGDEVSLDPSQKVFSGTVDEYEALTSEEQAKYGYIASPDEIIDGGLNMIIPKNAGARNSIYRGEYLGSEVTTEQYDAIDNGTFDDLFIGDYWTIDGVNYRIASFNYWLHTGDTECAKNHIVLVPDTNLYDAAMNDTNVVTGAYVGSKMYTTNLATAKSTINSAFGSAHVLNHREYLKNTVSDGYETAGAWYDSTVELMTEEMVYGGKEFKNVVGTNSVAQFTISKSQLNLFTLDPSKICNRVSWWLRDVAASTTFAAVNNYGLCSAHNASNSFGVRPAFAICKAN